MAQQPLNPLTQIFPSKIEQLFSAFKPGFLAALSALVLFMGSCSTTSSISTRNVSYLYQSSSEAPSFDLGLHTSRDGEERFDIIWRISSDNLGIRRDQQGRVYHDLIFRYKLYATYSDAEPIDSGKVIIRDLPKSAGPVLSDTLRLEVSSNQRFVLDLSCVDLNAARSAQRYIDLDASSRFNGHDLSVFTKENKMLFTPFMSNQDTHLLKINGAYSNVYARVYHRKFQMAAAPFAIIDPKPFDFEPDYLMKLEKDTKGKFQLPSRSNTFYQIVVDTTAYVGPTLYAFSEHFPSPRTVEDLIEPLRYITTNDEFKRVKSSSSKKGVDEYWLKIAGSKARAKELIKAYYTRVTKANELFTSYLEGWKSDRGMCYIVYGAPDIVNRSTSTETWIYGETGAYSSLILTFTKVSNPLADNDFRLNRSTALKSSWYRAVDFWRQGRVITYR